MREGGRTCRAWRALSSPMPLCFGMQSLQYLDEACRQLERERGASEHTCSPSNRWLPRPAATREGLTRAAGPEPSRPSCTGAVAGRLRGVARGGARPLRRGAGCQISPAPGGQGGPHTASDTAKRSSLQPSLESALSLSRGSQGHSDLAPATGELGGSVWGEGSSRRRAQSGCGAAENASPGGLGHGFWEAHLSFARSARRSSGPGERQGGCAEGSAYR